MNRAVERFAPITLEEMDGVKLLNRIDTKFLTDELTLVKVLEDALSQGYAALFVDGARLSRYNSIYYDTPSLKMFLDHHNRRLVRQKVRTRTYLNSGLTFLEIKRKNNHGRTRKKRIVLPGEELMNFAGDASACEYLRRHSDFSAEDLDVVLCTSFSRITLVNPARTERITIDTDIHFTNFRTGHRACLEDAVIIELKQDSHSSSQMKGILLGNRVKPASLSKYCIAVTLTDPCVKSNRFKTKVRRIEKTINKKIQTI